MSIIRFFAILCLVQMAFAQTGENKRGRIQVSPTSFTIDLNSGDVVEEVLNIENIDQSDLTVDLSFEVLDEARNTSFNAPGDEPDNHGLVTDRKPVRAMGGAPFENLASSPVPLTCLAIDPDTGLIYGQQNEGFAFYVYDQAALIWTRLADALNSSSNNGGATVLDGKIYCAYTQSTTAQIYDIATDTWSLLNGAVDTGNVATDGTYIYFCGSAQLKRYNPANQVFTSLTAPPTHEKWGGLVFHKGSLYYHIGNNNLFFNRYLISSDTWETLPNLPGGGVLGAAVGYNTYYAYGSYGGSNLYAFSIPDQSWEVSVLPFAVDDGGIVFYRDYLYLIQGQGGTGFVRLRLSQWLELTQESAVIPPFQNLDIGFSINTEGLSGGTYLGRIVVDSNDPVTPQASVPVTLNVMDAPNIRVAENLDVGQAFIGGSITTPLSLTNTGSLPLVVTNITTDNPVFTVSPTGFTLAAGQSTTVEVSLSPTAEGMADGLLAIESNADPVTVSLLGEGLLPPVIGATPTTLTFNLDSGAMESQQFNLGNTGDHPLTVTLSDDAFWLDLGTLSTTLDPGTDEDVSVLVDATGLIEGDYAATITLDSNDPLNPRLELEVDLHVRGFPDVLVTPTSLDFGLQPIGQVQRRELLVRNVGTGSLNVSNITADHGDFSATPTMFVVAPGEDLVVDVFFSPSATGMLTQSLTVFSDDDDVSVSLSGEGVHPADFSVSPTSLELMLNTGDTWVETFTVTNDEPGDLVVNLDLENAQAPRISLGTLPAHETRDPDSARVFSVPRRPAGSAALVSLSGVHIGYEGDFPSNVALVADLQARGATLSLLPATITDLTTYDVIWITEPYANSWSISESTLLQTWVANGGGLIVTGDDDIAKFNTLIPAEAGITYIDLGYIDDTTTEIFTHQTTTDIHTIVSVSAGARLELSGPALPLVEYSATSGRAGQILAAVSAHGQGRIFAAGNEMFRLESGDNVMFGNQVIDWLAQPLFSLEDASLTIPGNSSLQTDLLVDTKDIPAGVYRADLIASVSTPVQTNLRIPITVTINYAPRISVNPMDLDFDDTFVGYSNVAVLTVENEGTADLEVTDLSFDNGDFTTDVTLLTVPPGQTQTVNLFFSPGAAGPTAGVLTILSNDDPVTVNLAGNGLLAPVLTTDPTRFDLAMHTNTQQDETLTLTNNGGSDLMVDLSLITPRPRRAYTLNPAVGAANEDGDEWAGTEGERRAAPAQALLADLTGVVVCYDSIPGNWGTMIADLELRGATMAVLTHPVTDMGPYDVFWGVDNESADWTDEELAVLHQWIDDGGGILLEGEDGIDVFNRLLPDTAGITYLASVGSINDTTMEILPHPTTEGVTVLQLRNAGGVMVVEDPAQVVADYSPTSGRTGFNMAVAAQVGEGRILTLGNEILAYPGLGDNQLFGNRIFDWLARLKVNWAGLSPSQVVVPAGTSMEITLSMDTSSLNGGSHDFQIKLESNDPLMPELTVPVALTVTGDPVIATDITALDFGTLFVGEMQTLPLTVQNTGSDTLTVTDIFADAADISLDQTAFALEPEQEQVVQVTFAPSSAQTLAATLTLISNDDDLTVSLNGAAALEPLVSVNPSAYTFEAYGGQIIERTLTLINDGDGPLHYSLERGRVLIIGDGATEAAVQPMLEEMGLVVTLVDDDSLFTGSPSPADYDVVILLDGVNSGSDMPTSGQTALVNFVNGGGGLVVFEWIAFEIANGRYGTLAPLIPLNHERAEAGLFTYETALEHPVTEGVATSFTIETGANVGLAGSGSVLVTNRAGDDVVVSHQVGSGRVVQFATAGNWGGFTPMAEANMARLVQNAVNWVFDAWLFSTASDGLVPAHESRSVTLRFDLREAPVGQWPNSLVVWSNDPLTPELEVPIEITIDCSLDSIYPTLQPWPEVGTLQEAVSRLNNLCTP